MSPAASSVIAPSASTVSVVPPIVTVSFLSCTRERVAARQLHLDPAVVVRRVVRHLVDELARLAVGRSRLLVVEEAEHDRAVEVAADEDEDGEVADSRYRREAEPADRDRDMLQLERAPADAEVDGQIRVARASLVRDRPA